MTRNMAIWVSKDPSRSAEWILKSTRIFDINFWSKSPKNLWMSISEISETLSLGLDHFPGLGLGLENTHFPGLGLGLSLEYSWIRVSVSLVETVFLRSRSRTLKTGLADLWMKRKLMILLWMIRNRFSCSKVLRWEICMSKCYTNATYHRNFLNGLNLLIRYVVLIRDILLTGPSWAYL